ncbi:hypothetical protein [Curtobacterium sp. GD1]|uniref:hypothetical protein n=1 Tax=Curtobacterium sp. GD1 TaxID=2810612 RepID=UPI001E5AF6B4|nr:hypothetical protein [Curtobacterium sp. GD1]MCC8906358.1 hypothetical protein [Curtobacterium sp. GD1]
MTPPSIDELRQWPEEWHRRGMRHPDDVDALVHRRLIEDLPDEPVYSDFFGDPSTPVETTKPASRNARRRPMAHGDEAVRATR